MPTSIRPVRVNHMNVVYENFESSLAHLQELYGAEFVVDIPQPEWHAYLFAIGGVLFEAFCPHLFLLNMKYGPHFLGIEYQADMDDVRAAIAERGIRIARDIGLAVHTHPQDTFGASFEFYGDEFVTRPWPLLGDRPHKSPAEWNETSPLKLKGQVGYAHVVNDLDAGLAFYKSFLSAEVVEQVERPAIGARAVVVRVAEILVELQTPTGPGAVEQFLRRYGDGIRTTVFAASDLDQARAYFQERGVAVGPGDTADSFQVAPAANLEVIFEFRG
jgi:hypothetical protein